MIKVKYGDINTKGFITAFQEIKKQTIPLQAHYKFDKIAEKLNLEIGNFQKDYSEFLQKYSEKDEEGKPITEKNDDGVVVGFKIADPEGANKVYSEMLSREIEISINPIDAADLKLAPVSPETFHHLKPFISGLETLA